MTAKNKVNAKAITSDQLEKMFDNGDDILDYVDLDNPVVEHHPPLEKRITLTMPAWMVSELDEEAADLEAGRLRVIEIVKNKGGRRGSIQFWFCGSQQRFLAQWQGFYQSKLRMMEDDATA